MSSINYSISKEDFSLNYITIDTAIEGILANGRGCFLAKTDVDSAFRLIPLRPRDYELFGMQWEGKFYYDKVLPFGLRSALFLFNQLSEAVEWLLLNHCSISFVCHILDDFLVIEPPSPIAPHNLACQQNLSSMLLTFRNLGIPVAPHKTQGPSTTLEFMGIVLDSDRMEARLLPDKVQRLTSCFTECKGRRSYTLKELQSLIGSLNFACKVIPPVRPFLQRMVQLTRNVSLPHHRIKLSQGFFKDLRMWEDFICNWNEAGFFYVFSLGHFRCLVSVHRCLWFSGIWGHFSNPLVLGLMGTPSKARSARDLHCMARIVCLCCCLSSMGQFFLKQAYSVFL